MCARWEPMAESNVDLSSVMQGLDKLGSPQLKESLARRMAVAGGRVFRDEAKRWTPVKEGTLRDSVYVAFRDRESKEGFASYRVSWNARVAPHGHLIEFGHWQTHARYIGSDGEWHTGAPLPQPKWVAAKPFLRPAWSVGEREAQQAMMEAGREALTDLLRGVDQPPDGGIV